ncbi:MAG: hypothetical protein V3S40_12850 [Kiloniellales bacterium]
MTGCVSPDITARHSAETLDRIEPGATSREDVIFLIGLPKSTGKNGGVFFYRWELSGTIALIPAPPIVFPVGHVSFQILRVDFDNRGIVSDIRSRQETLIVPFDFIKDVGYSLASEAEDSEAKRFLGSPDACTVYIYVRRLGGNYFSTAFPFVVEIDRQLVGDVGADYWYYRRAISPGPHEVDLLRSQRHRVFRFEQTFMPPSAPLVRNVEDSLTFQCAAGGLYFFQVRIGIVSGHPSLRPIDPEEGREAIGQGNLLIGPP